jgi:heme-degrading monooxygenase HmoA
MITRIVKMKFHAENIPAFIAFFEERKGTIKSFPGCLHVELLRETGGRTTCFTYSHWTDEEALRAYRSSPFFKDTWKYTRSLFSEKAEAWSLSPLANK